MKDGIILKIVIVVGLIVVIGLPVAIVVTTQSDAKQHAEKESADRKQAELDGRNAFARHVLITSKPDSYGDDWMRGWQQADVEHKQEEESIKQKRKGDILLFARRVHGPKRTLEIRPPLLL